MLLKWKGEATIFMQGKRRCAKMTIMMQKSLQNFGYGLLVQQNGSEIGSTNQSFGIQLTNQSSLAVGRRLRLARHNTLTKLKG